MLIDTSLAEDISSLYNVYVDVPQQASSLHLQPSATLSSYGSKIQHSHGMLITTPPELRLRNPTPQTQSSDCQAADQSASQAIQQASQSIQQATQQAQQSASQLIQAANQSASQAIQQANNLASQSIAAASSSVARAVLSASNSIANAESSASAAISRANASASAFGAQASRQVDQASQEAKALQRAAITAEKAAIIIIGSIVASTLITILIFLLIMQCRKRKKQKKRKKKAEENETLGNVYSADHKSPLPAPVARSQSTPNTVTNRSSDSMDGTTLTPGDANRSTSSAETNSDLKTTTVKWNSREPPKAPTLSSWLKTQDRVSPSGQIKLPVNDVDSSAPLRGQLKSPMITYPTPQRTNKKDSVFRESAQVSPKTMYPGTIPPVPHNLKSPRLPFMFGETPTVVTAKPGLITAAPSGPIRIAPVASSNVAAQLQPYPGPQQKTKGPEQKPRLQEKQKYAEPVLKRAPTSGTYSESNYSNWTDDLPNPSPAPLLQPLLRSPPPKLRASAFKDPFANQNSIRRKRSERRQVNPMRAVHPMEHPTPVYPARNTVEWLAAQGQVYGRKERAYSGVGGGMSFQSSTSAEISLNSAPVERKLSLGLPRGGPKSGFAFVERPPEPLKFAPVGQKSLAPPRGGPKSGRPARPDLGRPRRKSIGLPRGGPKSGFGSPSTSRPAWGGPRRGDVVRVRRREAEREYGQGLWNFTGGEMDERFRRRMDSDRSMSTWSDSTVASTPGGSNVRMTSVGRAF